MKDLAISLPPETVEEIADRAAELVLARLAERDNGGPGWIYGARGLSEYTGLPVGQVFKLVAAGAIPHRRIGQRLLFERAAIDEWLRNEGG